MLGWLGTAFPCARTGCQGLGIFEVAVDLGSGPLRAMLCISCLGSLDECLGAMADESRAMKDEARTGGLIDHEV